MCCTTERAELNAFCKTGFVDYSSVRHPPSSTLERKLERICGIVRRDAPTEYGRGLQPFLTSSQSACCKRPTVLDSAPGCTNAHCFSISMHSLRHTTLADSRLLRPGRLGQSSFFWPAGPGTAGQRSGAPGSGRKSCGRDVHGRELRKAVFRSLPGPTVTAAAPPAATGRSRSRV